MIFDIIRASDEGGRRAKRQPHPRAFKGDDGEWKVQITTLEELMAMLDEADCGDGLIVSRRDIWIYDDYME